MKVLAFLFLSLFSLPAMAQDSFLLYQKDAWRVHYDATGEYPVCVASVEEDGLYFSLDVTPTALDAWYRNETNNFGDVGQWGSMSLWIDTNPAWNTPSYAERQWVQMYNLHADFLNQMEFGQRLWIDQDGDGRWDAWFSLDGSRAAMWALVDCAQKLRGAPA